MCSFTFANLFAGKETWGKYLAFSEGEFFPIFGMLTSSSVGILLYILSLISCLCSSRPVPNFSQLLFWEGGNGQIQKKWCNITTLHHSQLAPGKPHGRTLWSTPFTLVKKNMAAGNSRCPMMLPIQALCCKQNKKQVVQPVVSAEPMLPIPAASLDDHCQNQVAGVSWGKALHWVQGQSPPAPYWGLYFYLGRKYHDRNGPSEGHVTNDTTTNYEPFSFSVAHILEVSSARTKEVRGQWQESMAHTCIYSGCTMERKTKPMKSGSHLEVNPDSQVWWTWSDRWSHILKFPTEVFSCSACPEL